MKRNDELLIQTQNGDWSGMEELVRALRRKMDLMIQNTYYQFSVDWDKEDFQQDVMIKFLKCLPKYDPTRGGFFAWVNKLVHSVYLDHNRSKENCPETIPAFGLDDEENEYSLIDLAFTSNSAEQEFFLSELDDCYSECMEMLPDQQRRAIELAFAGIKSAEIAKILNCSSHDVSNWKNRFFQKLKEMIESRDLQEDLLL